MLPHSWLHNLQMMNGLHKGIFVPIVTEVAVLADAAPQEECQGATKVTTVDWNSVELPECTDLVIAPISDIEMARMFGIPVDDKYKEKDIDESKMPADANRNSPFSEDVDQELMEDAID